MFVIWLLSIDVGGIVCFLVGGGAKVSGGVRGKPLICLGGQNGYVL